MVRKDCFGYDARCEVRKKARCTALNNLYCENENCKFYKTRDEYERQERRKDGRGGKGKTHQKICRILRKYQEPQEQT